MPRIDHLWTVSEFNQAERDRELRESMIRVASADYRRCLSTEWSYYGISQRDYDNHMRVANAARERGDTPECTYHAVEFPPLPNSDDEDVPCMTCNFRSRMSLTGEGCFACRPDVFRRCRCGYTYQLPLGCTCWFTCAGCRNDGYHDLDYRGEDENGTSVQFCSLGCVERCQMEECRGCSTFVNHSSGYCTSCRPCQCGGCYECRNRVRIHSYSYRPTPRFFGDGKLFLGLENEIDPINLATSLMAITEYVNDELIDSTGREIGYLKSDGSLSCDGFELVTHPMSYQWALDNFPWHMYEVITGTHGVRQRESAGIHVHASREGFNGPRHVYLWQKFFYRNADPIQRVARRRNSTWARFSPDARQAALYFSQGKKSGEDCPRDAWYLPKPYKEYGKEQFRRYGYTSVQGPHLARYSAINVQNEHTFEVRIFAGSVKPVEIQAALGLVHASIEYTRNLDSRSVIKAKGWDWSTFSKWTQDRSEYNSLNSEIERLVRN